MEENPFQDCAPSIDDNPLLRAPQKEAYAALRAFAASSDESEREIGIVLPVGCGKSGCIALAPFAFGARRTLVVAPNVRIAEQLSNDFDPAHASCFYQRCKILSGQPFPEPVEIRGSSTNRADLDEAHVVVTNIQQLQGDQNRWLRDLPGDFFDLILFDEGHHTTASSWQLLKSTFGAAEIVNFSATPLRADGQLMAGRIVYSYSVAQAMSQGYVKHLKAIVLNPRTLRYIRHEDGKEVEVGLDEVRSLGEDDADFRRSIVTSTESLNVIVDASIRELDKRRSDTGESRLKIIASALNYEHCRQIVNAYTARGRKAAYVHSREDGSANQKVMQRLESHDLDVIVQVRKLGEGFDHPWLSVAAVFSVFANLSPFVQFVGRIMRVIKQGSPGDALNSGSVIFHAGANIAERWQDFQRFSDADQEYFGQLLPLENLDFGSNDELEIEPPRRNTGKRFDVIGQADVRLQEIPLIAKDPEAQAALKMLRDRGYSPDEVNQAYAELEPVPVTKVRQRQADRKSLDTRVQSEAGRALLERGLNPEGRELDQAHIGRSNFVVVKAAIDHELNAFIDRGTNERDKFTQSDLDRLGQHFPSILNRALNKVFNAES